MKLSLSDVGGATGGSLSGPQTLQITGVSIDSRRIAPGDLFVALSGEHLDGHDFVRDAFLSGAAAAMVEREMPGVPHVVVDNCMDALARFAAYVRDVVDPIVVGITGSVGKTSTKDLLASICSRKFSTVASPLSYNAELGLPLTLLSMSNETEIVVCEMGSRGRGQISSLCKIARPQVGVVTNVGVAHYEQFRSREAIANGKAELIHALPEGGSAVLNADDSLVEAMKSKTSATVILFGHSTSADLRAEQVRVDEASRPTFRIVSGYVGSYEGVWVTLPMSGRHQVMNALAASAAAVALGLSLEDCRAGLESARSSPWRMEVHSANGIVVVNDSYNANPDSMASSLEASREMVTEGGRLIAVLGYMAELGEIEESEHLQIGRLSARLADELVVVSPRARAIAQGAREAGMTRVNAVDDAIDAIEPLQNLRPGDVVLVKGSRVAGLETLANILLGKAAGR